MTPYYDHGGIKIYNANCFDVFCCVCPADVGLVLTDPPYGISYGGHSSPAEVGRGHRKRLRFAGRPVFGDDKDFDPKPLLPFGRCVLFGANFYYDKLPGGGGWFVWDKTGGGKGPRNSFSDVELAWVSFERRAFFYSHMWKGLTRDSEAGEAVLHTTQKPVAMMKYIIEKWTSPGDLVLTHIPAVGQFCWRRKSLAGEP